MPYGVSTAVWSRMPAADRVSVRRDYERRQAAAEAKRRSNPDYINSQRGLAAARTAQGIYNIAGVPAYVSDAEKRNRARTRQVQQALRRAGYRISVDGVWGPQTEAAYRHFTTPSGKGKYGLEFVGQGATQWLAYDYQRKRAAAARRVREQAARLEASIRAAQRAGDLDPLDAKIAVAQFWQKVGGNDMYGQFRGMGKGATKELKQLIAIRGEKQKQTAQLRADAAKQKGLGAKLKSVFTAATTFPSRFAYAFQRAQDIQTVEDLQADRGGPFQFAQSFRETFERPLTSGVAGLAAGFRFASRLKAAPFAQRIAEAVDDEHERRELVAKGIMETPGQRFARDILGRRDESREASDEARRRGLTGHAKYKFVKDQVEAARQRFIASGGQPRAGYGRESGYAGSIISGVGDVAAQVLVDPLNIVGAGLVRATTVIGPKAAQTVIRSAAGQAMLKRAGIQAAKAAERKDISLLLKTVPGLQGAAANAASKATLIAALTDSSGRAAETYLRNAARTLGGDAAGAAVRRDLITEARRSLAIEGKLNARSAEDILRVALGAEWKPTLSLKSRVTGAVLKGAINENAAIDVLSRMAWFSKAAKNVSLTYSARRALTSGRAGYVGRRIFDDPRLASASPLLRKFAESGELRHVKSDAAALRKRQVGVTKKGKPKLVTANTVTDFNRRFAAAVGVADELPDGVIKESIETRLDALRVRIVEDLDSKLSSLSQGEIALLQQSKEYLKARRAILQEESLSAFGTEGALKWAELLRELDTAIAKVADVKLDKNLTAALSRMEADILTARAVSKEAYANAEKVMARDIADFETLARHGHSQQLRQGLLRRLGERARRVPLVFADMTWSKDHINLESVDERGTFARDFARLLNAPFQEAEEARWAATQAGLHDDDLGETMRDIVRSLVENWGARQGHTPAEIRELLAVQETSLQEWLKENGGALARAEMGGGRRRELSRAGIEEARNRTPEFAPRGQGGIYGRVMGDEGALVTLDRPQAITQGQNWMAVPAVDELRTWSLVTKRQRVDKSLFASAGLAGQTAARIAAGRARAFVYPVHRLWKQWVVVGGGFRYILRVAVLEERNRMVTAQGMGSALPIGIYARRMNQYLMREHHVGFTNWSAIGDHATPDFFAHRKFAKAGELKVLGRDEDGYVENLWHLVNHQVNPDSDMVASMLLQTLHRKGTPEWKRDREDAINWLRTEDGRTYLADYRSLNGADVDAEDVVDAWSEWARSIVPNDALAQRRMDGLIDYRTLDENKVDWPDEIYGRPFEGGPVQAAMHPIKTLQRLVVESPTIGLNRQPFAFIEYRNELRHLTASGIDWQEASRLANSHAINRTNSILYDASRRSKFAAAMDPLFPFQAAREEQVRVWANLAKQRPDRVISQVARIARVFNAGEDEGIFYKDQYGDYRMRARLGILRPFARFMADYVPDWVPLERQVRAYGENELFDKMELSFRLRDIMFIQMNEMPAFTTNPAAAWAAGALIPQVGGPWFQVGMGMFMEHNRQLFPKNPYIREYLFPYGVQDWANLGRPELRYLFGAVMGTTWNDQETHALQDRIIQDFYFRNKRMPTEGELDEAFQAMMLVKAGMGVMLPARIITDLGGEMEWRRQVKRYKDALGEDFMGSLLGFHPELLPYAVSPKYDSAVDAYRKQNGDIDWQRLRNEKPDLWKAIQIGVADEDFSKAVGDEEWANFVRDRRSLDPGKYQARIEGARQKNEMLKEFYRAIELDNPVNQAKALQQWERKWSDEDVYKARTDDFFKLKRLDNILKVGDQDERRRLLTELQLDARWSNSKLEGNIADRRRKHVAFDGYMSARPYDELDELWRTQKGLSLEGFVTKKLTPHEASKFLSLRMADANSYDEWSEANRLRGELWRDNADVLSDRMKTEAERASTDYWTRKLDTARDNIGRLYDRIKYVTKQLEAIKAQFAELDKQNKYVPGLGTTYRRLKAQRDALYAQVRGIQNAMYNTVPDLKSVQDEVRLMKAYQAWMDRGRPGGHPDFQKLGFTTMESDEERRWERMPPRVQDDYVRGVVRGLNEGSFRWEWTTDFQKDLLRDLGFATEQTEDRWKRLARDAEAKYRKGFGRKGWEVWGHKVGDGFGELAFAIEMFKQYNKRGGLSEPTAELAELTRIGDNPVVRAHYLRTHPRVREWIRLGPMMQMPAGVAEMVRHIMTKYNRWDDNDGTGRADWSWSEVIEVAWAKQMLQKWNKRRPGEQSPRTYELWLKMPTGKAKADYLNQHPEIERWLQRGPMANMPDEYQEVVRDIMERFGLWEGRQDPLGDLINAYYALPAHARQGFLERHPEILAYWRALRAPGRERELFDLAQRYFALSDPAAKRDFLKMHPELQDYFVDERHRRYEQFLRKVAQYLGSYPDVANAYLKDQTRFLKQLLDKYGQKPLVVREATVRYGGRRA